MKKTSAKKFLESKGINLETTSLITLVEGKFRQPDLCHLMEEFHEHCINNSDNQVTGFTTEEETQQTQDQH